MLSQADRSIGHLFPFRVFGPRAENKSLNKFEQPETDGIPSKTKRGA